MIKPRRAKHDPVICAKVTAENEGQASTEACVRGKHETVTHHLPLQYQVSALPPAPDPGSSSNSLTTNLNKSQYNCTLLHSLLYGCTEATVLLWQYS